MKNSGCGYEITGKHGTQKNPQKNKKKNSCLLYTNKNCSVNISIGNFFEVLMSCPYHRIIDSEFL